MGLVTWVATMTRVCSFCLSGGSRLSACPREIVTVEVKLLAHCFLSLMINSLFASGSWLCYSLCYCIFRLFLPIVFVDCHVLTIEMTTHCCHLPFQCGIHSDYPDEASGCPHNHAGFVRSIIGFPWC